MHAVGYILMTICSLAIALTLSSVRPMMWFTNNWMAFPVYLLPALAIWILVHQHGKNWYTTIYQVC